MSAGAGKSGRQHHETIVRKVSRRGHDEDHGGNWKVAFADFCLALLCLFMVLWLLASRENEEAARKQAISAVYDGGSGIFNGTDEPGLPTDTDLSSSEAPAADASSAQKGEPYASDAELKALAQELEKEAGEAHLETNLQVVMTPAGLRVMLHDTFRQGIFGLGSAMPDPRFGQLMERMGQLFSRIGNPLLVVGHTDAFQFPDETLRSNWHLSSERALAARASLMRGGMPAGHLLQVVGMADRAPLDSKDPHSALNRRIEFLVLTRERARSMVQMFGAPEAVVPLIDGVDAAGPDAGNASEGEMLRSVPST